MAIILDILTVQAYQDLEQKGMGKVHSKLWNSLQNATQNIASFDQFATYISTRCGGTMPLHCLSERLPIYLLYVHILLESFSGVFFSFSLIVSSSCSLSDVCVFPVSVFVCVKYNPLFFHLLSYMLLLIK